MKKSDRGVPLTMAYGEPVSGKSTAASIAMSILGHTTSIDGTFNQTCSNHYCCKSIMFHVIFILVYVSEFEESISEIDRLVVVWC